jgi:hypothetical protein
MSHKNCKIVKLLPEHNPKRKMILYPEPKITQEDINEFFDNYTCGVDPYDDKPVKEVVIIPKKDNNTNLKIKKDERTISKRKD